MFRWLKRYMPRGLYGRATLILVLPMVCVQFVVSLVFIQRHFEGVTEQMSGAVAAELSYLLEQIDHDPPGAAGFAQAMQFTLAPGGEVGAARAVYDLSGRVVERVLHARLPQLRAVDLCGAGRCDQRSVRLALDLPSGPLVVGFARARVSASNPHQLLVILAVFGALMTGIAYLYLRNQLRPITRLAAAAQAYGRGQIAPYRLAGATEVRAAGAAFLDMRARIERQTQARRLMLSGISHDLRTPLTRMRLALSLTDAETAAPLLRDVEDMQRLVDAFLDYARSDTEEDAAPCDLGQLLRAAVGDAQRGGGAVAVGPLADVALQLRPMALRRAIDNLIGNALRYAGQVELGLVLGARSVHIVVDDDGPGIPDAQRDEALRPFVRLDPARNQDQGTGVGLGLAIVADVARAHGGRLALGTSPLGGLRAELILPR